MSVDHNLQLRRAILPMLKAETVIASLTAGRVYSEAPPSLPAYPFIRYGFSSGVPTEWSCGEGDIITVSIHAFSKANGTDECARLLRSISKALDGKSAQLEIDPDTGKSAYAIEIRQTLSRIFRDSDEASAFHGVSDFEVVVWESREQTAP